MAPGTPLPNQGCVYHDRVGPRDQGLTVLAYHAARYPRQAGGGWEAAIAAGRVRVNGRTVPAEQELRSGDRLEFHRPPWVEPAAPEVFQVVHEDAALLVIEKPAGLQVLPGGPFHLRTLLGLVRASAPERATAAPVHRLGRGTSGLILFGKDAATRAALSAQLRAQEARKTYLAWAEGTALPASADARHPIGLVPHGPLHLACAHPEGRPARTRVRVLRREPERARTLVAAQPLTGRANQIRVHLAALGAPLVGDPLFGPGGVAKDDVVPGAGGYFLHAAALAVVHPRHGRWLRLRSWPPWLSREARP